MKRTKRCFDCSKLGDVEISLGCNIFKSRGEVYLGKNMPSELCRILFPLQSASCLGETRRSFSNVIIRREMNARPGRELVHRGCPLSEAVRYRDGG